jgi:hypothetical protein
VFIRQVTADESQGYGKLVFNGFFADLHVISNFFNGKPFPPAFNKYFPALYRQHGHQVIELTFQGIEIDFPGRFHLKVLCYPGFIKGFFLNTASEILPDDNECSFTNERV